MHNVGRKTMFFINTLLDNRGELSRAMMLRHSYMEFTAGECAAIAETLNMAGAIRVTRDAKGQIIYIMDKEFQDELTKEKLNGHEVAGRKVQ